MTNIERIQSNNAELREAIEIAEALPDVGSGEVEVTLQEKSVTPTKSLQTVQADSEYDGLSTVTVNPIPDEYISTNDATAEASEVFSGETAYVNGEKITGIFTIDDELAAQDDLISQIQTALQNKTSAGEADSVIEPLTITENGTYTAPEGVDGYSPVTVEVPIPDSFDSFIGDRAFVVTGVGTTVPDWGFQNAKAPFEVDLPYVTEIKGGAFYGCTELTKVKLPLLRTTNASAFYGCQALIDVYMPIASAISSYMFYTCTSLEVVDFPSAKDLWNYSFKGCTSLKTLILRLSTMCGLRNVNALESTPIAEGTGFVYVPKALVDSYKSATNWSVYANQIRAIEDYPDICG